MLEPDILVLTVGGLWASQMGTVSERVADNPRVFHVDAGWFNGWKTDLLSLVAAVRGNLPSLTKLAVACHSMGVLNSHALALGTRVDLWSCMDPSWGAEPEQSLIIPDYLVGPPHKFQWWQRLRAGIEPKLLFTNVLGAVNDPQPWTINEDHNGIPHNDIVVSAFVREINAL